jgi:hypothetical protein
VGSLCRCERGPHPHARHTHATTDRGAATLRTVAHSGEDRIGARCALLVQHQLSCRVDSRGGVRSLPSRAQPRARVDARFRPQHWSALGHKLVHGPEAAIRDRRAAKRGKTCRRGSVRATQVSNKRGRQFVLESSSPATCTSRSRQSSRRCRSKPVRSRHARCRAETRRRISRSRADSRVQRSCGAPFDYEMRLQGTAGWELSGACQIW